MADVFDDTGKLRCVCGIPIEADMLVEDWCRFQSHEFGSRKERAYVFDGEIVDDMAVELHRKGYIVQCIGATFVKSIINSPQSKVYSIICEWRAP